MNINFKTKYVDYPYPIASLCNDYRKIPEHDAVIRHGKLADLFETIVKLVAIFMISEDHIYGNQIRKVFPKGLDFLKQPSLGHWLMIIRNLSNLTWEEDHYWCSSLTHWYKGGKAEKEVFACFKDLPEINPQSGLPPVAGITEALVAYRNRVWKGHGAHAPRKETLQKRIAALETLIAFLLDQASFFNNANMFFVETVYTIGKDEFEAECLSLIGKEPEKARFRFSNLRPKELYIARGDSPLSTQIPFTISPLVEWLMNDKKEFQFYFYNYAKRTSLDYLCYLDGSHISYKELKKELESIIKVTIEKSGDIKEFYLHNYSENERRQASIEKHNQGIALMERGNYDAAIIKFEEALDYLPEPEICVDMCRAMLHAGDEKEIVRANLITALEINPGFEPAVKMLEHLDDHYQSAIADSKTNQNEKFFTYYEYILPGRLKNYSLLIWVLLISSFYTFSGIALFFLDKPNRYLHLTVTLLFSVEALVLTVGIISAKQRYLDSYHTLLGQLDGTRDKTFRSFFLDQASRLFGYFIVTKKGGKPSEHRLSEEIETSETCWEQKVVMQKERRFLLIWLTFVLVFGANIITIQKLGEFSLSVALLRFLETLLIWVLVFPAARYAISSTMFIKYYSLLDLTPLITNNVDNGFRRIGRFYTQNLILLNLFWVMNWSWNALVARDPYYIDFLGLLFALIIVVFWTVITPVFVAKALQISKSKAVADYKLHLRRAYDRFLKNPDDLTLQKLEWLVKNERWVSKLSTSLFSFTQWLLIVLTNILVLVSSAGFILIRLNAINLQSMVETGRLFPFH